MHNFLRHGVVSNTVGSIQWRHQLYGTEAGASRFTRKITDKLTAIEETTWGRIFPKYLATF